jgi:hypothetical protein
MEWTGLTGLARFATPSSDPVDLANPANPVYFFSRV